MLPGYGQDISYAEALEQNRANVDERWLGRQQDNRLEPEAWPRVTPRFRLRQGQRIFTMGSCFARNIEEYLKQLGFDIPTLRMVAPQDASGGRSNAILNKYTPVAIVQELEWTRRIVDRGGGVQWADIEPLLLEVGPDQYLDMHLSTSTPVPRERAMARREELFSINKDGFESDVVVITPGVIEAWRDAARGLFIQQMPPPRVAKRLGEGRFRFKVLTYEECYAALSKAVDLIDPHGSKWFLFTVSPVPLRRTFTDQDVVIANQYSKSLLRAVIGRICSERINCDYFPSYESVILTKQAHVWQNDLVHVTDAFVSKIVHRLVSSRLDGASQAQLDMAALLIEFDEALRSEKSEDALAIYRMLGARALEIEVAAFHEKAIELLLNAGDRQNALLHARRFIELRPSKWKPLYLLAWVQYRLGNRGLARRTAAEALAIASKARQKAVVKKLIRLFSTAEADGEAGQGSVR
jgi:tetratricopeptide (TPR) repeat protein